jgi:hypothetical protein
MFWLPNQPGRGSIQRLRQPPRDTGSGSRQYLPFLGVVGDLVLETGSSRFSSTSFRSHCRHRQLLVRQGGGALPSGKSVVISRHQPAADNSSARCILRWDSSLKRAVRRVLLSTAADLDQAGEDRPASFLFSTSNLANSASAAGGFVDAACTAVIPAVTCTSCWRNPLVFEGNCIRAAPGLFVMFR